MKKRLTATALLLIMALTLWAGAALLYENFLMVKPVLDFNGTTAECAMKIEADEGVKFRATMSLYRVDGSKDVLLKEWALRQPPVWSMRGPTAASPAVRPTS